MPALPLLRNQPGFLQDRQMVRNRRIGELKLRRQLPRWTPSCFQEFKHPPPRRVVQCPERLLESHEKILVISMFI